MATHRLTFHRKASRRSGARLAVVAVAVAAATVALTGPGQLRPADAADLPSGNVGFESGLTGWTQFGTGGNVATTERAYEGRQSAKVADANGTDATGLESTRQAASAGRRYVAFAKVNVVSGKPDLYLRFHDSAGALKGTAYTSFSGSLNTWTALRVSGTAPAGTTRVSALAYSSKGNAGTAYFDEVLLTADVTNLGVQVDNSQVNGATFGVGAHQDKIHGIFTGSNDHATHPARFATIDADTAAVVGASAPMPGAVGGWAATTATDGNVYLGSYSNGHVYRHTPGGTGVTDLGQAVAGQVFIWDLTAGDDGRVYGGTYSGASYFKYEPTTGFSQIGSKPIWSGKQYVRSIAYDPAAQATYLGVGTNAALVRFDRVTGAKHNILPAKYAGDSMVGGLTFTGGRLFAVMANGALSVLNVVEDASGAVTATEEAALSSSSRMMSPAQDGKVYFLRSGQLHSYDLASRQFTALPVTTPVGASRFGWVRLADQTAFPGLTLVGVGASEGRTYLFKYNPTNGASNTTAVTGTPLQPTNINSVGAGPDGKVYTGGYLTGATGVYSPLRGDANDLTPETVHRGLSQTDSMLAVGDKLYFGNYSGARIHEYDPSAPWSYGTNPRQIMALSTQNQDRPYALAAGGGKLFVGTVPKYGRYDGALTVYDIATGQHTTTPNIVADQSVVALAYHDGKVYGGTTIRGGLGVDTTPRATEAKLFVYDVATGAKTEYALPASRKLTAVTALRVVDGKVWGFAEGFLFVFDPATNRFTTSPVEKFTDVRYTYGSWNDAELVTVAHDPAHVYGTIGNYLFKVNKSTLAVTKLVTTGADSLATDSHGNLYYSRYETLYRYAP